MIMFLLLFIWIHLLFREFLMKLIFFPEGFFLHNKPEEQEDKLHRSDPTKWTNCFKLLGSSLCSIWCSLFLVGKQIWPNSVTVHRHGSCCLRISFFLM